MRRAACPCNNHLITVAFGAFSKAEELIGRAVGRDHFDMIRNVQGIRVSAVNCMVAQSLLDPITMAIRAELLREDMRLKTPVGVFHTALEATENSMNCQ